MVDGAKEFSRAEFDWVCKPPKFAVHELHTRTGNFGDPGVGPAGAPYDLSLLRAYNSVLRQRARDSRNADLLAELHAVKRTGRYTYVDMLESLDGGRPQTDRRMPVFTAKPPEPLLNSPAPALEAPSAEEAAPLEIPDFPSRIK